MLKEDNPCNVMPADIVANGIIIAAYECGKKYEKRYVKQLNDKQFALNCTETKR